MPKPSGTNHPKLARLLGGRPGVRRAGRQARAACLQAVCQSHTPEVPARRDCGGYSVWAHLFPFRTEKLKQTAPMVLPEEGGRVGRRPIPQPPHTRGLFFALTATTCILSDPTTCPICPLIFFFQKPLSSILSFK